MAISISDRVDFKPGLAGRNREILQIDKGRYPSMVCNNYKYMQIQYCYTQFCEKILLDIKAQIDPNIIIMCDYSPTLLLVDMQSR